MENWMNIPKSAHSVLPPHISKELGNKGRKANRGKKPGKTPLL